MEIYAYLWLSLLLAFLLALIVPFPAKLKNETLLLVCTIATLIFYWAAFNYHIHYIVIIAVSTILIYLCIDIAGVTNRSKKIFGHVRDIEIGEAREDVANLAHTASLVHIDASGMDEDAVITNTVEYTARALVPLAVAPLFYAVVFGPLGAIIYRYLDIITSRSRSVMTILDYIPARLAFAAFWVSTSTVTKNRVYMMGIVKRDIFSSLNHTADLIVAGFAGTTWMKLGGEKKLYLDKSKTNPSVSLNFPSFGDMREPPHISDILRATKLFDLTVIIFIVLAICIREYEFIWYFLKKFVI